MKNGLPIFNARKATLLTFKKITMKKYIIFILFPSLGLASCNFISEKKKDLSKELSETIIEKTTGQKIDAPNTENAEKTKVKVDLNLDGENLASTYQNASANIVITAAGITFLINTAEQEKSAQNIMIGITQDDIASAAKPFKGSLNNDPANKPQFSLAVASFSSDEILSYIAKDGAIEIVSFNDNKVEIKVNGKVSTGSDDPSKWKPLEGTITIDYPVIVGWGEKKSTVTY